MGGFSPVACAQKKKFALAIWPTSWANVRTGGVGRNPYSSAGMASVASARLRRIVAFMAFATLARKGDRAFSYPASVVCASDERDTHAKRSVNTSIRAIEVLLKRFMARLPLPSTQPTHVPGPFL